MLIDTHCHLDFGEFDEDRSAVMENAKASGIEYFINVGSNLEGSRKSVELAAEYERVFASVGIHPHHAGEVTESALNEIKLLAENKKVVAIGEVGLDYCKSPAPPERQKEVFCKFIEISKKLELPLIIHSRDASRDTLDTLKKMFSFPIKGVMHCFSGGEEELREVLDMGMFVSFTCNLTFKNAKRLREIAKHVPPKRLLLETDAPFLAPQVYRGKRNEPAYITELRDILSELLNLPKEEVEKITTDNAKKLFGLKI